MSVWGECEGQRDGENISETMRDICFINTISSAIVQTVSTLPNTTHKKIIIIK